MEPITIWVKANGEWSLVHRCNGCGCLKGNRIAADDNAFLLMSLAARPVAQPPFRWMHWADRSAAKIREAIDVGCSAMTPRAQPEPSDAALGFLREHPVLCGIFTFCIVAGATLGAVLLAEDWSIARRLAAGAVAGAGVALLTTAPRIIG